MKECSNYPTIVLMSHACKVMLKILQARLQQDLHHELPDVQARLRKGRGTRDQSANIRCINKKAIKIQKYIYFCFIDFEKTFDYGSQQSGKFLEMGLSDHLICPGNLYAGQEATVRIGHETTLIPNRERSMEGCLLSP